MADKETRKRRKRTKETTTKKVSFTDDTELESSPAREQHMKPEKHSENCEELFHRVHEPSFFARVVFFLLFALLIAAVGLIVFSLPTTQKSSLDIWEDNHSDDIFDEVLPIITDESEIIQADPNKGEEDGTEESVAPVEASDLHPWAQHESPKPPEPNFDALYEETEDEKEEVSPVQDAVVPVQSEISEDMSREVFYDEEDLVSRIEEKVNDDLETYSPPNIIDQSSVYKELHQPQYNDESFVEEFIEDQTDQLQGQNINVNEFQGQDYVIQGQDDLDHDQDDVNQGQDDVNHGHNDINQGQDDKDQGQDDINHGQDDINQGNVNEDDLDFEEFEDDDDASEVEGQDNVKEPVDEDFNEFEDEGEGPTEHYQEEIQVEGSIPEETVSIAEENVYSEAIEPSSVQAELTDRSKKEEIQEEQEEVYDKDDITNDYDFLFRDELDDADQLIDKSPEQSLQIFEDLLVRHSHSPRAHYGLSRSLDQMAELQKDNSLLTKAINSYKNLMTLEKVPDKLYLMAANRCIDRMRFRGLVGKALALQSQVVIRFPDNLEVQNQLAVSYLMFGRGQDAKNIFQQVLIKNPGSGFAKAHLGFILKTEDKLYPEAVGYLREGIASREEGVIDGRFYFHLGDALSRMGQHHQAMEVYRQGTDEGLFLSPLQRSLYNVEGLSAKPWWQPEETPFYNHLLRLEERWIDIREEALALMTDDKGSAFEPEAEGLQDTGDWQQFNLFVRGSKISGSCQRAPKTCQLIEEIPEAAGCKRGQVKFSLMQPGTHVWAHTGPTNCRLRAHLGLVVPPGTRMRVADIDRSWSEGKFLIFDDSFEHEVWHEGNSSRLILIVDFWHPDLTHQQKESLTPL